MKILLYAFLSNLEFGFVQNEFPTIQHLPRMFQYSPDVLQKLGRNAPVNRPMVIGKQK